MKNSALTVTKDRKIVEIYDLYKGSSKQKFTNKKQNNGFTAITSSEFNEPSSVQNYANSLGFNQNNIFKQSIKIYFIFTYRCHLSCW